MSALAGLLAHQAQPPEPHDLWAAWSLHPLAVLGLVLPACLYLRGRARTSRGHEKGRERCAALGMIVLAVALLSPVDALGGALASAHMVQHVMLTMVAAPLLALGSPLATILMGMPRGLRQFASELPRVVVLRSVLQPMRRPIVAWVLHVAALWVWHSAVLYDAAVRHPLIHAVEHLSFIATGILFWHTVLGGRRRAVSAGTGLMLVFTMALQGVLLSALLTFASTPWYGAYTMTRKWGLDPLTDQQLAGVIMWIPGGLIYLGAALGLLAAWIREGDRPGPGALAVSSGR